MELLNIELSEDPAIPLGIYPEENHNSEAHMHPSAHCSSIYNSQDMETTWISNNRWMETEVVVCMYDGILLSH